MNDNFFICLASCRNTNNNGARVSNDFYDLDCISQCSERRTTLYHNIEDKYTRILQVIIVILLTFGLIGKLFNGIIFLRTPFRQTSTGLLLLLKTLFDTILLLWIFIFNTKFFFQEKQINESQFICVSSRSSDIFVSWSIGFVILACTIHLVTIIHSKYLLQPTRFRIIVFILLMMLCGLIYNWHIFYYPNLITTTIMDDKNHLFTYCNTLFGNQMGYFSFGGFRSTQEFLYNAPLINFIVLSLIPFAIVAITSIVILVYVLKTSSKRIVKTNLDNNDTLLSDNVQHSDQLSEHTETQSTKKDITDETILILVTSCIFCVFLIFSSVANLYVYIKSSYNSNRSHLTEDLKTANVYLILRMVTLFGMVLEFYIYLLTAKKFRDEVFHVIHAVFTLRNWCKSTRLSSSSSSI